MSIRKRHFRLRTSDKIAGAALLLSAVNFVAFLVQTNSINTQTTFVGYQAEVAALGEEDTLVGKIHSVQETLSNLEGWKADIEQWRAQAGDGRGGPDPDPLLKRDLELLSNAGALVTRAKFSEQQALGVELSSALEVCDYFYGKDDRGSKDILEDVQIRIAIAKGLIEVTQSSQHLIEEIKLKPNGIKGFIQSDLSSAQLQDIRSLKQNLDAISETRKYRSMIDTQLSDIPWGLKFLRDGIEQETNACVALKCRLQKSDDEIGRMLRSPSSNGGVTPPRSRGQCG